MNRLMPSSSRSLTHQVLPADEDPMMCDDEMEQSSPVGDWIDIDEADVENPLCVTDFVMDIYENVYQKQVRLFPSNPFMSLFQV